MSTFQTLLHLLVVGIGVMNLLDVLSIVELGASSEGSSEAYRNGARAGGLVWVGVGAFAAYRLWQARGPADAVSTPATGASSTYVGPGGRAAVPYPSAPAAQSYPPQPQAVQPYAYPQPQAAQPYAYPPQPQAAQQYAYPPQPQAAQPYAYPPQPQAAPGQPSVAPPAAPHTEASE